MAQLAGLCDSFSHSQFRFCQHFQWKLAFLQNARQWAEDYLVVFIFFFCRLNRQREHSEGRSLAEDRMRRWFFDLRDCFWMSFCYCTHWLAPRYLKRWSLVEALLRTICSFQTLHTLPEVSNGANTKCVQKYWRRRIQRWVRLRNQTTWGRSHEVTRLRQN